MAKKIINCKALISIITNYIEKNNIKTDFMRILNNEILKRSLCNKIVINNEVFTNEEEALFPYLFIANTLEELYEKYDYNNDDKLFDVKLSGINDNNFLEINKYKQKLIDPHYQLEFSLKCVWDDVRYIS